MTIVKVVKVPKLFQKKEDKRYPLSDLGYVQMLWDIKQAKLGKINSIISITIIIGMFGIGLLSKELLILLLTGKGMNKFASWMIG